MPAAIALPAPAAGTILVRGWSMIARIRSTVTGGSGCGSCVGLCLGLSTSCAAFTGISPRTTARPEDALEQHQGLALRGRAHLRVRHLVPQVLDHHRRDLAQLVITEARQKVNPPHLQVAPPSVRCKVRDRIPWPPLLLHELGEGAL